LVSRVIGGTLADVFENGVLRKILGHKSEEITDDKRKLPNEVLHELETLPPNIRKSYEVDEMGEACSK
jgi:hypothetical protein